MIQKELMRVLKVELKARGISQSRAARDLRVSVPTLKRWLSGRGIGLDSFGKLLNYLGLSLVDLVELLPQDQNFFEYSIEQERYFANHPKILAFFDGILNGKSPRKIAAESRVSQMEMRRILRILEKMGLLLRNPGDKVTLCVKGEPRWRVGGPLSVAFRESCLKQLLQHSHTENFVGVYNLLPSDRSIIFERLKDLKIFLHQAENRARRKDTSVPLTIAFLRMEQKPHFLSVNELVHT